MKVLKCRDLGNNCNFIVTGNNADNIKNDILNHLRKDHTDSFFNMSEEDKADTYHRIDVLLSRGCGCGAL
ncbi:DUF1059 domain-containing protein [Methanosalsum natronophilum]|uniref:DUF1059 domain-containing protein n=1 Tax=Methanosalsum natronophilum TaxID=768733 RepID=A0A3R7XI95_9EURY|nr:DUF1059 domain-containing protein [Methanosalsum natronophilum]MCS3924176.1 putative small metal-binding protein [Methanosalsum natronophilum]RQD85621.1 MAG: DUF1059 domain-containing protein [Methanosalsum natronophilum]